MQGRAGPPLSRPPRPPSPNADAARPTTAPPAESFPAFPPAWYYLCPSGRLRNEPKSVDVSGRRLVVFRDARGRPRALDAHCAHMGADLGGGRVREGRLCCPFHGWEYAGDGRCVRVPAQAGVPAFARQRAHAVIERHGLLFAFLGGEPTFELPELFARDREPAGRALREEPIVPSRPYRYYMDCPWYVFGANGFDVQHFSVVHDRVLLAEPVVDSPAPFARRIRFTSRVAGRTLPDRLVRHLVGPTAEVTITSWAGTVIAVTAEFRRAVSRALFALSPDGPHRTRADLFALIERGGWWRRPAEALSLRIRRALVLAFLRGDIREVRRAVYRPDSLIEADRVMVGYYRWLASLPRGPAENPPARSPCNGKGER